MCRYYYRDGLCANISVKDRECAGLGSCPVSAMKPECAPEPGCGHDKWYGLYCDKYKRFFCAGMGNCETFENYMKHFANNMSKPRGPGSGNEMHL